jgi:hypothetical protein
VRRSSCRIFYRSLARMMALAVGIFFGSSLALMAGDSSVPKTNADGMAVPNDTEEESETPNSIELGVGGLISNGDAAQFKQEHHIPGDVFGGIEDFHYEHLVGKKGQFSLDGHAIFDDNNYDVKLELSQPELGYIRAGYDEFRTWYDGNGGFFPVNGQFFPPPIPEMHIDRGEAWVERGLRLPDWPEITLRYSHEFRDGQKDSTSWGDTTLTGLTADQVARKIAPAYRDIDETRDILALDIAKTFGKTDLDLGMRYEHADNDNRLQLVRGAGQVPPLVAAPGNQRFVTQEDKMNLDLFSGHAIAETHFSDSFWLTSAYSFTTLGSDIGGSRIYGPTYNSSYSDPISNLGMFDHGFLNLAGTSELEQHVVNLNLMWLPVKDLTILSAFRYTHEEKQSDSAFVETSTRSSPLVPMLANSFENFNKFAETLELRYAGIRDWLFYASGDWEDETGDIHESLQEVGTPAVAGVKEIDILRQKYTAGFNWYPTFRLNVAGQYFHKIYSWENQSTVDGQQLDNQDWNTDDLNIRLTWRPHLPTAWGTIAFVTRYDFRITSVAGQWSIPDEAPFSSEHTALIRDHVLTESVTWNPLARLYFQGNFSYVLNETKTPASNIEIVSGAGPTILNFQNDYWTVEASVGYLLNDKSEFHAVYSYYRADDYVDNSLAGLPLGTGAEEHTISATLTRQLTKRVRLRLQYGYFNYTDALFGGHNDYEAHSIFSSLAFAF